MPDFGMMTAGHVIYIPLMFTLGLIAGYMLGGRSAVRRMARVRQRMKE